MYRPRRTTNVGPTGSNPGLAIQRLVFGSRAREEDSPAVSQGSQAKKRRLSRSGGWAKENRTRIPLYSSDMAKSSIKRSGSRIAKRRYTKRSTKGRTRRPLSRARPTRKFRTRKSPARSYKRRSTGGRGGFAKRVLNVVTRQNQAINTYKTSRVDFFDLNQVDGSTARALVCYRNCKNYANGQAPGTALLMPTDDPHILTDIANNIDASKTTRYTRLAYKVSGKVTNMSNHAADVVHYRCRVRKDVPPVQVGSTLGTFQTIVQSGFLGNNNGLGNAAVDGVNQVQGASCTIPQAYSLFENVQFVKHFKITKVKTHHMEPASSFKLFYKLSKPRVVKHNDYTNLTNAYLQELYGGQYFSVFVIRGVLGYDKSLAANLQLGYTGADIAYEQHIEVDYTWTVDGSKAFGMNQYTTGLARGHVPAPIVENFNQNVVVYNDGQAKFTTGSIGQTAWSTNPDPIVEDGDQ
ncbi:hypothetical protein [McMurdo Ice Shelf pond-associated circular DNA virus-4]|uniref:hypothetical protein n=1 Tax=McMurdo Ice Shelf pond-associated circular DNA virus-4 TaxID=1521388 RepID=UPI0004D1396C|nr:hypothetical protein [McMurdo Ice Shelf pond-associated circular DNA virus-4]AIF71511.1 hypothetical protein [McMurdo Ice Shelf pond-associated circular DNA virus-4]